MLKLITSLQESPIDRDLYNQLKLMRMTLKLYNLLGQQAQCTKALNLYAKTLDKHSKVPTDSRLSPHIRFFIDMCTETSNYIVDQYKSLYSEVQKNFINYWY